MPLGLNLSLGRGGAASAGIPASATHLVLPQDMTFNGSNVVTGVTDQIAASSAYFTPAGSVTGSTTTGIDLATTSGTDYVRLDLFDPAVSVSFLLERNVSTWTNARVVIMNESQNEYNLVAQNGNTGGLSLGSRVTQDGVRKDGADITLTNRDTLWDGLNLDVSGQVVVSIKDAGSQLGYLTPFHYQNDNTFTYPGYLKGWMVHDWADADAASAYLLSA